MNKKTLWAITVAYHPGTELLELAQSYLNCSKTSATLCAHPTQCGDAQSDNTQSDDAESIKPSGTKKILEMHERCLLVVDNSPDGWIAKNRPKLLQELRNMGVVLVGDGTNRGYGGAVNYGVHYLIENNLWDVGDCSSVDKWFLVVNPDVVFHPSSVDVLLAQASILPHAGVIGPSTYDEDGSYYPSARNFPRLSNGIGHALLGKIYPNNPWTKKYVGKAHECKTICRVGWVSGSCMLVNKEAFLEIEGFDEEYFMFFEDVDLCERLTKAGWLVFYTADASITHKRSVSWKQAPVEMIKAHHASAKQYLGKVYSKPWQIPLQAVLRGGLSARAKIACRLATSMPKNINPTIRTETETETKTEIENETETKSKTESHVQVEEIPKGNTSA